MHLRLGITILVSVLGSVALQAEDSDPKPLTFQAKFDAASSQIDSGNHAEALASFEVLEAEIKAGTKPSTSNLAIVGLYKGKALLGLTRYDEAQRATEAALATGAFDKPSMKTLKQVAMEQSAQLLAIRQEDGAAAARYGLLRELADTVDWKVLYGLKQAQLLIILEPERSLKLIDEVASLAQTMPTLTKEDSAALQTTRGRALLNLGRVKEARESFGKAIKLRGGLDYKIDPTEFTMRADAAIAALRDGDEVEARNLLAMSGQGRTGEPLPRPDSFELPPCGGLTGLSPDDYAVIEVNLAPNGTVTYARPVFASRPGLAGYEFSGMARDWTWRSERIRNVAPFFLSRLRFEVRCSQATSRPTTAITREEVQQWLLAQPSFKSPAPIGSSIQALIEQAKSEPDPLRALELWLRASWALDASDADISFAREQAAAVAGKAAAPMELQAMLRVASLVHNDRSAGYKVFLARTISNTLPLLSDTNIAQDFAASSRLRLHMARLRAEAKQFDAELQLLDSVLADARLPEKHPYRTAALVAKADNAVASGKPEIAAKAYAETGLTPSQCAALSQPPVRLRTNVGMNDFPEEALRWGFEGWVMTEFDIGANGRTENIRPVLSYPPAVFNQASSTIAKGVAYRKSFRPDGSAGCTGSMETINFSIPSF